MQIHVPDPAYTGSERARANFRLAVKIALGFVALLWVIQLSDWALDLGPAEFGVRPRQLAGLPGILVAPLMHGGFGHLIANSPPLAVLGTAMLYLYPRSALRVLPAVYLGPGIAVWMFAQGSSHVGASGLVYGLVSYIFVAGLIRRDKRAIAASLLVSFMYGALVWGVLPIEVGVSWETHLAAALIGITLAITLRHLDIPPRRRYSWEDEGDEHEQDDSDRHGEPKQSRTRRRKDRLSEAKNNFRAEHTLRARYAGRIESLPPRIERVIASSDLPASSPLSCAAADDVCTRLPVSTLPET
jgi:membrane associated rhomboid family serine protease